MVTRNKAPFVENFFVDGSHQKKRKPKRLAKRADGPGQKRARMNVSMDESIGDFSKLLPNPHEKRKPLIR